LSYNNYLKEYHRMLDLGYSEREADRIADEAAFEEMLLAGSQQYRPYDNVPSCDICGEGDAVTATNGWFVCSEDCHHQAMNKEKRPSA
jgi:hypothetical protein